MRDPTGTGLDARFETLRIAPGARIVVLTGAGISKESGLDTFRDPDGIWARHAIEDVATPEAFRRDPALVHAFYNDRRRGLLDPRVRPNAAHEALVRLERGWPGEVLIVTQNVDDLHDRAGSRALVHMHGELLRRRCAICGESGPCREALSPETPCPSCGQAGGLRPDVVWFGEMPLAMERIYGALGRCGLFVSIGTSGNVYPAAGFVRAAGDAGAVTVELNLEPSSGAGLFDLAAHGPATRLVPAFVDGLLGRAEAGRTGDRKREQRS